MMKSALLALAMTAGMTTAAIAQDNINVSAGADSRTAAVNVGDLNLASASGQSALHARLNDAAKQVCTFGASRFDVDTACAADAQREASAQAVALINASANGKVAQSTVVLHGAK